MCARVRPIGIEVILPTIGRCLHQLAEYPQDDPAIYVISACNILHGITYQGTHSRQEKHGWGYYQEAYKLYSGVLKL